MKWWLKIEVFLLVASLKTTVKVSKTIESLSFNKGKLKELEQKIVKPIVVIQEKIDREELEKIVENDTFGKPLRKDEASHSYVNILYTSCKW